MDLSFFVDINVKLAELAAAASQFNVILFMTDVTKDSVSNWPDNQVTKSYGPGEILNDFPSTSHAAKVAAGIFAQNPQVSSFKIGRRDPDQSAVDALSVIKAQDSAWYALVGLRGLNDILGAAGWVEQNKKFMFAADYSPEEITSSDKSIGALLKNLGYRRTVLFHNNQAGFTIPDADLTLTVADNECSVIASGGPQAEEVTVDAVVENFTYSIDVDGEVAEYETVANYNTQINKVTILRAVDSHVYRVSIDGTLKTYQATVPTDTEEDIKNELKTLINADLVLQQKMSAVDEPGGDTSSLHLIGQNDNTAYEVIVGENVQNTPQTTLVPPTQSEIAAALQAALLANATINDEFTVVLSNGGESLIITIKDEAESFTLTTSANLTNTVILFDYGFLVGDPINIGGVEVPLQLNGDFFISEVTAINEFKFKVTAPNGVPTGTITLEANYTFPDARAAGMGLAYANGTIDYAHQDIVGVRPETDQYLTSEVVNNLGSKNVNFFQTTNDIRGFWEGRVSSGLFIDIIIDGFDYLPTRIAEAVFSFLSSQQKVPMSDASLGTVKNVIDRALEQEGRARGITAPFIENKVLYPETGFPPGARAGDHYVSRVPRVRDIPLSDRQNRQITSGIEFYFQTAGGIHRITIDGTLLQ